jgi:hypothetical protein
MIRSLMDRLFSTSASESDSTGIKELQQRSREIAAKHRRERHAPVSSLADQIADSCYQLCHQPAEDLKGCLTMESQRERMGYATFFATMIGALETGAEDAKVAIDRGLYLLSLRMQDPKGFLAAMRTAIDRCWEIYHENAKAEWTEVLAHWVLQMDDEEDLPMNSVIIVHAALQSAWVSHRAYAQVILAA